MIHNPMDVSTHVTPQLSALIERLVNDPDADEAATLSTVRDYLTGLLPPAFNEAERMHHFDVSESMIDEINTLIDEFGADAAAADFVRSNATEALSCVIEAMVDDENRAGPPTLSAVRQALSDGLGARLVGEGVLDEDEDDALMAEIDALLEHFGPDAIAEDLLHYE